MAIASLPNVLPSSTNPTRPYTTDTTDNLFYMTVVTHHLNPANPEDIAFAQSRIRAETEAAEDVLHDLGVLSMYSSDSQAMGRIGDTVATCWRTADKMKKLTGSLAGDPPEHDNERILRYLAKLTINPALAHGIGHLVGSLEPGKVADIVLWPTNTFGVKPKMVVKGGLIVWAAMGDPNASIPTPEPVLLRPMFAALGSAVARTSITFVSQAAVEGRRAGAAGPGAVGRAGAWLPHDRQGADGAQRRHAGDPRRPGDLPGHRRRQAGHRRGCGRGGDVAALLHRLMPEARGLAGLLSVLQLSDSAFPSGRYTLSHGLETFAQEGLLERPCPPAALAALLGDCIRFGVGPSDGVALACAHRAVAPDGSIDLELVARADERLSAVKLAREAREASTRTGRALLVTATAIAGSRSDRLRRARRGRAGPRQPRGRRWACSTPCSACRDSRRSPGSCTRSPPAGPRLRCGSA